jgi:hypothetical protein
MNPTSNTAEPSPEDAVIRELLLSANRQDIQPPRDLVYRVRARLHQDTAPARTLWDTIPIVSKARRLRDTIVSIPRPRWMRRAALAAAATAAMVLIALFFSLPPTSSAWSQIGQAVRAMPWIHLKAIGGDGKTRESWLSFSRNVAAMRDDDMTRYDDLRSGIRYEYDAQHKKLYRLAATPAAARELASAEALFQAIFRGNAIREEDYFPRIRIVKQRQRTVTEQGRQWLLYELELRSGDPDSKDVNNALGMLIRVDPQKLLPVSLTVTSEREKQEVTFDYPAEGPADVYALGVPRHTVIEDRTPPPDLSRILKLVEQNRREFGNYLAVAGDDSKSVMNMRIIRCKDGKLRIDMCGTEQYFQRNGKMERVGKYVRVKSPADVSNWWRAYGKDMQTSPALLYDGREVYRGAGSGWKPDPYLRWDDRRLGAESAVDSGQYLVELLAYPRTLSPEELASASFYTAHLDPKGENGPPGSIRVVRLLTSRDARYHSAFHKEEFWLQPRYSYAVVKYTLSDCPAAAADPLRKELTYEYAAFRQSPRGMWYPTVSRCKNASTTENKNNPGGVEFHDRVTYFYLDFTADMPDELFRAVP